MTVIVVYDRNRMRLPDIHQIDLVPLHDTESERVQLYRDGTLVAEFKASSVVSMQVIP